MKTNYNKLKLTGVFLLLLLTVIGKPDTVRAAAAEKIGLNQSYQIQVPDSSDPFLYEFTVPEAGNINVQVKNADPVGTERVKVQLYDSNNNALTDAWYGVNVELPVYPTGGNRTFYIRLSNYYSDAAFYFLTVNFQPTTDWETEDNNTTAKADPITSGKKWYGAINDMNDPCDYFRFRLSSNKKVTITFGPGEVSGENNRWNVNLINSSNKSQRIYESGSTTQTYTCYLKKGTYYLQVENYYSDNNVVYALSYKESALKLEQPAITSMKLTGHESFWGSYVELSSIRIKNSGDATGYTVRVAKKKSMKGKLATENIDFKDTNTKKQVVFPADLPVLKTYYVQVRSYVTDPFGTRIYGKYGAVKSKSLSSSVYKKLK